MSDPKGADISSLKSEENKYAIHEACREGKLLTVESLLTANPKLANLADLDERYPIHWSCSFNHKSIVDLLMGQKGFDPDIQDGMGWTPLMCAASIRDDEGEEVVKALLNMGADVNAKNYNGQTALHFTASKSNLSIARLLISHGATSRVKDKIMQQLPLHRAAAVGSVPMIRLLLEDKSPVNATDRNGYTALHHAIAEGHGDAALELLKAGAETDKKDVDGMLALQLAPDKKVVNWIRVQAANEGIEI
ncbi:26S proteasome non-ATPase regulatory subunit 10 [Kalaharituber pfeilii]|nr:26S proteasome non-ATPase regulatory subunit 10 [Kalaharituber pfeilii]